MSLLKSCTSLSKADDRPWWWERQVPFHLLAEALGGWGWGQRLLWRFLSLASRQCGTWAQAKQGLLTSYWVQWAVGLHDPSPDMWSLNSCRSLALHLHLPSESTWLSCSLLLWPSLRKGKLERGKDILWRLFSKFNAPDVTTAGAWDVFEPFWRLGEDVGVGFPAPSHVLFLFRSRWRAQQWKPWSTSHPFPH